MDWPTFVTKIFEALAWPSVALVITWKFKKEIFRLLPFLKSVKAGPLEVELFEQKAKEILQKTHALSQSSQSSPEVAPSLPSERSQQASSASTESLPEPLWVGIEDALHPTASIILSWRKIERALVALAQYAEPTKDFTRMPPSQLLNHLDKNGILTPKVATVIRDLRSLRNEVTHSSELEPSIDSALDYTQATNWVIEALAITQASTTPNKSYSSDIK